MPEEYGLRTEMNTIVPTFCKSIDPAFLDALIDISEMGLDSLVDAGVFDEVPVLKTLVGLGKTAANYREASFLKQVAAFLRELLSGALDDARLEEHKRKLESNPKVASKELTYILTLIDRNVDITRSEMHGRLYRAFLNKALSWSEFVDMSEVVSRCMISDMEFLKMICCGEIGESDASNGYRANRLASFGLIGQSVKTEVGNGNLTFSTHDLLSMTPFGLRFCQFALESFFGPRDANRQ